MDQNLLDNLKTFSIQDILEDGESISRVGTARTRGNRSLLSTAGSSRDKKEASSNEIKEIKKDKKSSLFEASSASERPESGTMMFSRANNHLRFVEDEGMPTDTNSRFTKRPKSTARNMSSTIEETVDIYIPDLDEVKEEELLSTVAEAPQAQNERIKSLKELDDELVESKPFTFMEGIDSKKFIQFLIPERELIESADEIWHWDNIFTEMSSVFQKKLNNDLEKDKS